MTNQKRIQPLVTALSLVLVVGGTGLVPLPQTLSPLPAAHAGGLFAVGTGQELDYGKQGDAQIVKTMSINHDPRLNDLVRSTGERLVPYTDRPDLHYTFRVINDKAVNAFSIPGYVYVQTGLLDFIKNDANMRDELAGVIAHELGHTGGRHIAKQLQERQTASILGAGVSIFTHGKYDNVVGAGANLFLLGHSRGDEYDADRRGVNTLMRAGVNPEGMVKFFKKLEAKYKDGSKISEYTQTHPLTNERIQRVEQEIRGNQAHGVPAPKSG